MCVCVCVCDSVYLVQWLELKGPDGKTPDGPRGDVLVYIHWSFDSSYDDVEAKMVRVPSCVCLHRVPC